MSRRRLTLLFIGVFSALAGSATTTYLRSTHCESAGGSWNFRRRACAVPAGAPPVALPVTDSMTGFGVTIALAAGLLWAVRVREQRV